jgi:hypothetical protein
MVFVFGTNLIAQDRFDVFAEYSYLRFSPTITGLSARDFNGGGGGAQLNFLKILGIKADVMAYGTTTFTRTINGTTIHSSGNMLTYMFGPVLRIPIWRIKPFGEVLFGASHTDAYTNLGSAISVSGITITRIQNQHPFTLAAGGGLDISITHHFGIRPAEFDYVLTRYSNPLTSTNNQNNFRYCGGLIFKF